MQGGGLSIQRPFWPSQPRTLPSRRAPSQLCTCPPPRLSLSSIATPFFHDHRIEDYVQPGYIYLIHPTAPGLASWGSGKGGPRHACSLLAVLVMLVPSPGSHPTIFPTMVPMLKDSQARPRSPEGSLSRTGHPFPAASTVSHLETLPGDNEQSHFS